MAYLKINRRTFLKVSSGVLGVGLVPAMYSSLQNFSEISNTPIIYIFLRGGADALSLIHPEEEHKGLISRRPNVMMNISKSSTWDNHLIHEKFESWDYLWKNNSLNIIQQVGSEGHKSHNIETIKKHRIFGDALFDNTKKNIPKWNYYLTSSRPDFFRNADNVFHLMHPMQDTISDNDNLNSLLYDFSMKKITNNPMINAILNHRSAINLACKGIPSIAEVPSEFHRNLQIIGELINQNMKFDIAYVELNGWDTHANQGTNTGSFSTNLEILINGVNSFLNSIEKHSQNYLIYIDSEFGRSINENGSFGTEHGQGGINFLISPKFKKSKVISQWQHLLPSMIDLPISIKSQDVVKEIRKHFSKSSKGSISLF